MTDQAVVLSMLRALEVRYYTHKRTNGPECFFTNFGGPQRGLVFFKFDTTGKCIERGQLSDDPIESMSETDRLTEGKAETPRERGEVLTTFTQDELYLELRTAHVCDCANYGAWPDHKRASVYNDHSREAFGPGYASIHGYLYPPGHFDGDRRDKYVLVKIVAG